MRVTRTATVTATNGAFMVSVSAPSKSYYGTTITLTAVWNDRTLGPFTGAINWGDGSANTPIDQVQKSVSSIHNYSTVGTFTITVTVYDEGTLTTGTGTWSIQIAAQLAATLSASPTSGKIPLPVTFTIGVSGGYTPYSWTLAYGDGTASDSGTVAGTKAHTYAKVGTWTATLTVTDALGATAIGRVVTYASVPPIPDIVYLIPGLAPLIAVASVVAAQELQKARIIG